MKLTNKKSTTLKTILIAIVTIMLVMASQSMNAADSTEKPLKVSNNIHTATYNQFSTSMHYRNW